MYIGSSNNYYMNMLYSNMLFGSNGSSGLFGGGSRVNGGNYMSAWNSMVPNFAQINQTMLYGYMSNNYNDIKDKLTSIKQNEAASSAFYSGFRSNFGELKSAAAALKSFSSGSVFRPTGYGSANGAVATVKADGTSGTLTDTYRLSVKQTAAAQSYGTKELDSKKTGFSGAASLSFTAADNSTRKLTFNFKSGTSNKEALGQIAESVNQAGLGITATLTEKDGKSALSFTADKTGAQSAFTVNYEGSGNLEISEKEEARDAKYSVGDGEEKTSQSNDIKLADGKLAVTLTGQGSTELSRKTRDDTRILSAVKDFAGSYNDALHFLEKNAGKSSALNSLAYSFGTTRLQSSSLSKIGINVGADGSLSVDEKAFSSALKEKPQDVERLLGGTSGLATMAYGKTVSAMNNSRSLYPTASATTYPNYMYGSDKNYISAYSSGLFMSSLA